MFRMTRRAREMARRNAATAEYQDLQDEATNVLRLIQTGLNRRATVELPTMNFHHVGEMVRIIETLSDLAANLTHED